MFFLTEFLPSRWQDIDPVVLFVCLFCHCCFFVLLSCVCFFFSIFTDLNFVLGHKTQIQLTFMTRGIKGLFLYLCNKITTIQPVFENGWLQSSNYTKKKEKKNRLPLLPALWHKFALLQIILGHQQVSTLKCNV